MAARYISVAASNWPSSSSSAAFWARSSCAGGAAWSGGWCGCLFPPRQVEVEPQLPARLDQPVSLPQQDLPAFDDHRKLGQRPLDLGEVAGQGGQLLLDGLGLHARGQQLSKPPRGADLLEIEIRQAADLAHGDDQPAAVPAADHGRRDPQEPGEHGGGVETVDFLREVHQAEALPELGLGDDLQVAMLEGLAGVVVEKLFGIHGGVQRGLCFAQHEKAHGGVGAVHERGPVLTQQAGRFALGHARQLAHQRDAPSLELHGRSVVGGGGHEG
jgi:hypothetical protein